MRATMAPRLRVGVNHTNDERTTPALVRSIELGTSRLPKLLLAASHVLRDDVYHRL